MTASIMAWGELMKASLDLVQTAARTNEMLTASRTVIASRVGSMAGAVRNPWGNDHVELARMVPEKVSAFSDSGRALAAQWGAVFAQATQHAGEVGALMLRGPFLKPAELARLSSDSVALATGIMANALKTGSVALAPIHKQAISNARRLTAA